MRTSPVLCFAGFFLRAAIFPIDPKAAWSAYCDTRMRRAGEEIRTSGHGQVICAEPNTFSCEPPSGFTMAEDCVPASTVAVPTNVGAHWAKPFWSTVTGGTMLPTHSPPVSPAHQTTSLLVS